MPTVTEHGDGWLYRCDCGTLCRASSDAVEYTCLSCGATQQRYERGPVQTASKKEAKPDVAEDAPAA